MAELDFKSVTTGHEEEEHHVLPVRVYVGVFVALIVLTYLTVLVSHWDLGPLSLPTAMIIAMIKAGLVVAFFMHLRYDNRLYKLLFFSSLFFLGTFFLFTFLDFTSRGALVAEEKTFYARLEKGAAVATPTKKTVEKEEPLRVALGLMAGTPAKKEAKKTGAAPAQAKKAGIAPPPKELLELGKKKYEMMCKVCHGDKGFGDGPAGQALNPKPSAFGKGEFRYGGTFESTLKVITKGTNKGMAPYGYLPEKERKALAYYVLHLSGAFKAKGEEKAKEEKKAELAAPPKEVLELGKKKYEMMCKVCHGDKGFGDGPAGQALNPKPSAFGKGEFRYGKSLEAVLKVITKGTNKGMAPYSYLPEKERKALAYYVLHLSGAFKSEAKPATKPASKKSVDSKKSPTKTVPQPKKPALTPPAKEVLELGKKKYEMMCKVCHGDKGFGDGPAGQALNPKPSAFGKGEFRYGKSLEAVLKVITKGTSKGMAPYSYLPEKERKALAYYVLYLSGAFKK